ncbi:hypothetical protein CEXT_286231 [Caerostris extrusa]|uniref:Uncharacterized protein n=1 Tax=Caerostris extrusa TaxID=172846 RepID=A0AAV4VLB8_CAEEX|nr:hypothetical protein CEXT_286231 [Caerostris extrusa]
MQNGEERLAIRTLTQLVASKRLSTLRSGGGYAPGTFGENQRGEPPSPALTPHCGRRSTLMGGELQINRVVFDFITLYNYSLSNGPTSFENENLQFGGGNLTSFLDSHQLCFADRKQTSVAGARVLDCFLLRDPQIARIVSQDEHPNVAIEREGRRASRASQDASTLHDEGALPYFYSTGARVTIAVKDFHGHFAVVFSCHK